MVTFNLELNNKPNRLGKYSIFIRITQDRKVKRLRTSVLLNSKNEWNSKKQEVRSSNPEYAKLNDTLKKEIAKAEQTYRDMKDAGPVSTYTLKEKIERLEKSESFLDFAREHAKSFYVAGKIPYWKRWVGFCNKLEEYAKSNGMDDITFADIDLDFLKRYETYLRKRRNERNAEKSLSPNTIYTQFKLFRTLMHEAERANRIQRNPFNVFFVSSENTVKEKLTREEIDRLLGLKLEIGSVKWHSRNMFMFSFYCAGIRVSDVLNLRWLNITTDGRLNYQMGKNHKLRDLVLVDQALAILSLYQTDQSTSADYIFPLMPKDKPWSNALQLEDRDTLPPEIKVLLDKCITAKTALVNKCLKQLATEAGIEKKLSMHISRHSFAKAAKNKGVDNLSVKELLAHSNIAVTEKYMGDFDTDQNDAALRKVFNEESEEEQLLKRLRALSPEALASLLRKLQEV